VDRDARFRGRRSFALSCFTKHANYKPERIERERVATAQHQVAVLAGLRERALTRVEVGGNPQHLRRVSFCDPETSKRLVFLTNNFVLPAATIAAIYKKRLAVEFSASVPRNQIRPRFQITFATKLAKAGIVSPEPPSSSLFEGR
jgi:hypothetical protein